MTNQEKNKQLMKILVGVAWIDGVIQSEEREYLRRMAIQTGLDNNEEIKSLLTEIQAVTANQCYEWLKQYLGDNHSQKDYEELLETISAMVYSDNDIDIQEAKLLSRLQDLDPQNVNNQSIFDRLLDSIRQLYNQGLKTD